MRFVNFSEYFPPHMGSDKRIFDLNNQFHEMGFDITFLLPIPMRELIDTDSNKKNFEKKALINGMLGFHMKPSRITKLVRKKKPILSLPFMVIDYLVFAFRKMKRINPDLVILNLSSHFPALLGLLIGKLYRKKIICDVPDLMSIYVQETFNLPFKSVFVKLLATIEVLVLKHTNYNITCTKFIRDYFIHKNVPASKLSVVYSGVYPALFKIQETNRFPKDGHTVEIDYAGRIDDWTGLDIIIDAAERLKNDNIDFHFNLFGDGNARKILEKLANKKGLEDFIKFYGFVPHEDIIKRYNDTDIALCLFRTSTLTHAALPVKLFEYLSMNLPTIASNLKGIKEIVTDNESAIILKHHTGEDMYNAILKFINDKHKAKQIADNGRALIEQKFDWRSLATSYIEILKKKKVI